MAVIRYARQHGTRRLWLAHIMERRPLKVAAVAVCTENPIRVDDVTESPKLAE
jgi:hypothetical protein